MKAFVAIIVIFIIMCLFHWVYMQIFGFIHKVDYPQKYEIYFGGVGIEPMILYAPTKDIAEKVSMLYMNIGFDFTEIRELSDEELEKQIEQ